MLGEFYKMIAANELHEQNLRTKELFSSSFAFKDFSSSPQKTIIRRKNKEGYDDWDINANTPKTSASKDRVNLSIGNPAREEIRHERPRTKSLTKSLSPQTKRILNATRGASNQDFSLVDNLVKVTTPLDIPLKKDLATFNQPMVSQRLSKRKPINRNLFHSDKNVLPKFNPNNSRF
mmetsp:Transcript_20016/g.19627  ORF Transcript_20016/g.19627 Transcript_20016/m.19627 type:complete len:177 (+) Transcript_20016:288-818(+)